jgi:hypothetical protein
VAVASRIHEPRHGESANREIFLRKFRQRPVGNAGSIGDQKNDIMGLPRSTAR